MEIKPCFSDLTLSGPLVKRLRHRPFTAVTRVRFPYGSPEKPPRFATRWFFVSFPPPQRGVLGSVLLLKNNGLKKKKQELYFILAKAIALW
jgi:hypothetical protein